MSSGSNGLRRGAISQQAGGVFSHWALSEPHLHSLDAPTLRLDKWLQHCTLWLCSRSSRPRCTPVRKPVNVQPENTYNLHECNSLFPLTISILPLCSRSLHPFQRHTRSVSIQGPPVWAVPGSLHFYTMHGCDFNISQRRSSKAN